MNGRLTQKVAGLPAWAWGLIIGLLAVAVMYWLRSRSAASNAAPATIATTPTISDVGIPSSGGGGQAVTPETGLETNGMWLANSLAFLISQGVSPLTAQQALASYLDGQTLTPAEQDAVNAALAHNGPPPQGTSGVSSVGTPTVQGYYRRSGTAAVYQALSDGTLKWLDYPTWIALGAPKPTDVTPNDPLWLRPITGADAPAVVREGFAK